MPGEIRMKTDERNSENSRQSKQDELAAESGLAIVLVDENSFVISESNNNSICRILYNSERFAAECAKFCGRVFEMTESAAEPVEYKCYANLNCLAVKMKKDEEKTVAIVGRAFLKAEDYRGATIRASEGDWQEFPADTLFENVLLSNAPEHLQKLAQKLEKLSKAEQAIMTGSTGAKSQDAALPETHSDNGGARQISDDATEAKSSIPRYRQWRSLFGSILELNYREACLAIMNFVEQQHAIKSLAWLERRENRLELVFASGDLHNREIQLSVPANDKYLLDAVANETSLEMRERQSENQIAEPQRIRLFPISVGGEIQSALIVGDKIETENTKRQLVRLCREIAPELEILRLREELTRRNFVARAVGKINESLQKIDSEDFWATLNNVSAEIMQSERSSLLVLDENSDALITKAATGIKADFLKNTNEHLGERVARMVINRGEAMVVGDLGKTTLNAAPEDRSYKSGSFISYPIMIGERRIGVLNFTDRVGGESYNNFDLALLDAIVPSLAVMIDRIDLKNKAGEFEQLSVTDALTGLLNRRYLEERLTEEIKRSTRHHFPMSFMMIDVDDFKSYNDNFGHPEGDKALQMVGARLKENLRGADVAARYGGEEFSILLPQTTSEEAAIIGERIRERVAQTEFPHRRVTVSIGIATCSIKLNSARDLISAADKALFKAKRAGRNNVRIYDEPDN